MASRRKLKKTIHFVCNELITEVCIRQLISGNKNEASVDSQIVKIAELGSEFCKRCNHPSGKNNSKLVKSYYNSLHANWNEKIKAIINELESK